MFLVYWGKGDVMSGESNISFIFAAVVARQRPTYNCPCEKTGVDTPIRTLRVPELPRWWKCLMRTHKVWSKTWKTPPVVSHEITKMSLETLEMPKTSQHMHLDCTFRHPDWPNPSAWIQSRRLDSIKAPGIAQSRRLDISPGWVCFKFVSGRERSWRIFGCRDQLERTWGGSLHLSFTP